MKGRRTQSPHSSVLEVTGMHIVFTLALVPAEGGGGGEYLSPARAKN
jgi:hypothetical protein